MGMQLSYRNPAYNGIMTARVRLNSALLPLLTVAMLVMQLANPSKTWQALVVAFGGLWLVAGVWARSLRGLRLTREIRFAWTQVGDALEEQFILTNDGYLPGTWVEVIDHSTLPGYSATRAIGIDMKSTNTWHTSGVCVRRGVFEVGGTTLRSGDPFGVYTVEIFLPEKSTLVVMPPVVPLPLVEVAPGGWMGDGRPRPNIMDQTVNAATVREFANSDSPKLIHWPTTARRGKLFSRVLDGAPASDWWIALDVDSNVQAGQGWENTVELGVILAASLANRGLRARHPQGVGLLASGEQTVWFKPQSGERHRLDILRALAVLEPGQLPLSELLERANPTLGNRVSLIVITPSIRNDWLPSLTHLLWKGISPTILLMDPSSFGAPQNADSLASLLAKMGIPRFILNRSLLQQPEARPGWKGQWEWRITPSGRAIPMHPPGDLTWKRLE
jgi:uncharacterized protein (DUF58 family)